MKLIIAAVLLSTLVASTMALKCYSCNSNVDGEEDCGADTPQPSWKTENCRGRGFIGTERCIFMKGGVEAGFRRTCGYQMACDVMNQLNKAANADANVADICFTCEGDKCLPSN